MRFVPFAVYRTDPAQRNQVPEGWMTPGYVARSWHIPRGALLAELKLPPTSDRPHSFGEIAVARDVPSSQVLGEVSAAIAVLRAKAPVE